MDGNPATVWCFFVNGRGQRETRGKEKATQPQRTRIHGDGAAKKKTKKKNLNTSLKTLSRKASHTTETYGKIVCKLFFLQLHNEEIFQGIALTFTFTPSFSKA